MADIMILDDSRASSAFLKMTLARHRHRVNRTAVIQDVINHPSGSAPDLVLINQALRNNSGWDIFNHLKRIATHIPVMVYVLDNLSTTNAAWIVEAVQEAISETTYHSARQPDASVKGMLFVKGTPTLKMA